MYGLGQDVPATMKKTLFHPQSMIRYHLGETTLLFRFYLSHTLPAELLAQGLVKRPTLESQQLK